MDETLAGLLARTTTCAVSDVLMKRGQPLFMRQRIRQVGTLRVIGRALTIERPSIARAPRANPKPNRLLIELIEGAAPGTVLVMTTDSEREAGLWGGLLAAAAVNRKLGGVVCDGPLRDPEEIIELGCPTFATGTVPAGAAGILTLGAIGEPVLCGGVPVHTGDLVFGDSNGVVVVPQGTEHEVLAEAVEVERADQEAMARIRAGAGLLDTMRALGRA